MYIEKYDSIACEYYDPRRHPTCQNFGELSERFLRTHVVSHFREDRWSLEIGVGRSLIAPILAEVSAVLDHIILLDNSAAMLAHSAEWTPVGASLLVCDARAVALRDGLAHLVVASLGDPYNYLPFWIEVRRLLAADGTCLFTLPSIEWAERFRDASAADRAEFIVAGQTVAVPSNIISVEAQVNMIAAAGLRVDEITGYPAAALASDRSSKLDVLNDAIADVPVVRGFVVRRR